MKKSAMIAGMILVASMAFLAFGQGRQGQAKGGQGKGGEQAAAPAPDPTVVPQPQVKSNEEGQALMAVLQAPDTDARIKAADDMLAKFPDTEFKSTVLQLAAASYQEKNDFPNTVAYAEKVLAVDPNNFQALLMLAGMYVQNTKDKDLDMEEKLSKGEGYAKQAIEAIKTALRPRPDVTQEMWDGAKKDFTSQAYETLGTAAIIRKKYQEAADYFKQSLEVASNQEPTTKIRLANAYNYLERYDDAIAMLDQVLADQQLNPTFRRVAEQEKLRATTLKSKK